MLAKILSFAWNTYLFGSIHMALCVVLFTEYCLIFAGLSALDHYSFFLGFGTLAIYTMHRIIGSYRIPLQDMNARYLTLVAIRPMLIFLFLCGLVFAIYFLLQLSINAFSYLLLPVAFTIAYVLPIFPKNKRLRDFDYIKVFVISIAFACLSVVVPALIADALNGVIILFAISKLFFLLGITLPFDIRDYHVDRKSNLKTFPLLFGLKNTVRLSLASISLSFAFAMMAIYSSGLSYNWIMVEMIVCIFASIVIWRTKASSSNIHFSFFLDGTLGLFYLVYWLLIT